jgi:hypothetical protein
MSLSTTKTRDYPKVDRMRGVNYLKTIDLADYTLANEDRGKVLLLTAGLGTNITVPALSIPVGSQIDFIAMTANTGTFIADTGVTLNSKGAALVLSDQFSGATLIMTAPGEWTLIGDLA